MYLAYSDASVKGKKCAAATLVMTEDTFIACFTKRYTNVSSSTEAELLGVIQTMEYVNANCSKEDSIVLLMDNKSVALRFIRMLSTKRVPNKIEFKDKYDYLLKLSTDFNISIQHIRGHQYTHNPNKVCDILSKICISN